MTAAQTEAEASAVLCYRMDGRWELEALPELLAEDLGRLVQAVGQQPSDDGPFALVDVAHEFFVVVRVQAGRVRLLLSDVTASVEWELAAQVLDHLEIEVPEDEDLDEVWPAGDLGVFDDLGLDAAEVGAILSDDDAYADEMLSAMAARLGFAERYERVLDALMG